MIQKKYLILLAISGLIITLDQLTKIYIHTQFQLGESIPIINDFFNITYVRNFGAAFGIFSTAQESFRNIFFLSMPPIAIVIIFYMLKGLSEKDQTETIAFSLVFGGAIGNYIDRLQFGYVVDFLDFHIRNKYTWPAFNIADSAIVSGVGILIILYFYVPFIENVKKNKA